MRSAGASRAGEEAVAGRTIITARALQRLAVGIAHDVARVAVGDVRVQLSDERGRLRIRVSVPVAITSDAGVPLVDRGPDLQRELVDRMRQLAGRDVSTVDVRYSGVRHDMEKRVR